MLNPTKYQQQQHTGSTSNAQSGQESSHFDVFGFANEELAQTSLLLKLTDECNAAIKDAIKSKSSIRMIVRNGETTIEVNGADGTLLKFKCILQNQTETDVIACDLKQKLYKNIGPPTTAKLQVQATEKTFADVKQKTQKLMEEEQQRKIKDMPKTQRTAKGSSFPLKKSLPTTTGTSTNNNFLTKLSSAKRTHSPSPFSIGGSNVKQQRKEPNEAAVTNKGPMTKVKPIKTEAERKADEAAAKFLAMKSEVQSLSLTNADPETSNKNLVYIPKRKPMQPRPPSISPASTTTSTPKTISPPLAMARPASVDSSLLQHSSSCSPDEATPEEHGSMTIPMKPTRDWSLEFGKIGTHEEAKRYHGIFKKDYHEYCQCYELMKRVADEFRSFQLALTDAIGHSERLKIEDQIRTKFAAYQNDQNFVMKRQMHHDLRAKLEVVKQMLIEWNGKP